MDRKLLIIVAVVAVVIIIIFSFMFFSYRPTVAKNPVKHKYLYLKHPKQNLQIGSGVSIGLTKSVAVAQSINLSSNMLLTKEMPSASSTGIGFKYVVFVCVTNATNSTCK